MILTKQQLNDIRLCVESNMPCAICSCYEKGYGCSVPKLVNSEQKMIKNLQKATQEECYAKTDSKVQKRR